jgi:hypothetical protein
MIQLVVHIQRILRTLSNFYPLIQEKDQKILEAEELAKPEKPKLMSDNEAKQKIMDRLEDMRRKPGKLLAMLYDRCSFCS